MTLRLLVCAAALAVVAAAPAFADDKADAKANCVILTEDAVGLSAMPAEQQPKLKTALDQMCTCMTDKIEGLGDDGAKVLKVLAKTTPEMAKASQGDPNGDRNNAIKIMVAEYGITEAEAGAIYDRVDPKVTEVGQQCQAELAKAFQ